MAEKREIKLNTIDEAIEDIKNGKVIIVVDDEDRENEGDFICAAEKITPEIVNFMVTHGRGLVCTSLPEERCEELGLDLMVGKNSAQFETPFTVSVDLIGDGCTTGISVQDRAKTIKALVNPDIDPDVLGRPGHIFPLKAKSRGVLRRAGHTEAAVDLAKMSGLYPGGVLVEIMNEDGSMARLPELYEVAKRFDLKLISIADLIAYRLESESILEKGESVKMPTEFGEFDLTVFRQKSNGLEHISLTKGEWNEDEAVLVRVHSSCATGDIFGSMKCDCGPQLHEAMRMIDKEGKGAIIYLMQEGRGIGLFNKIKAYKLQEEGRDTVEANVDLGFDADERDYGCGAEMLREIGVRKLKLISNNPLKHVGLQAYGLEVVNNISIEIPTNEHNHFYMTTKKSKMGHDLKKL